MLNKSLILFLLNLYVMKLLLRIIAVVVITVRMFVTAAEGQQISVVAGAYPRYQTIIEAALKTPLSSKYAYEVKNTLTGKKAAIEIKNNNVILFILPDSIKAGDSATYELVKAVTKNTSPIVITKSDSGLLVSVKKRPVFFYHTIPYLLPADSPSYYMRNGFIHPLYSPGGNILTDDFPVGHMHQHGIMMAWVNTRFKNTPVDFWNQHLQTGNVKHVTIEAVQNNIVTSTLKLRLQHYSKQFGEVLNELWTVTIYPFSSYFLFDIQSRQVNTTSDTLFLNQYHYGGLSFRGSRQWNSTDKDHFKVPWQIQTDSGFSLINANGKHAAYVTASGLINGRMACATILGFPTNFRYPQAIRVHPTMPYWCYAPIADGPFFIAPGQQYISGYRYFITDDPQPKKTAQLYNDLIHPVMVKIL